MCNWILQNTRSTPLLPNLRLLLWLRLHLRLHLLEHAWLLLELLLLELLLHSKVLAVKS